MRHRKSIGSRQQNTHSVSVRRSESGREREESLIKNANPPSLICVPFFSTVFDGKFLPPSYLPSMIRRLSPYFIHSHSSSLFFLLGDGVVHSSCIVVVC